jgi:SAM-dependent methyltransferase
MAEIAFPHLDWLSREHGVSAEALLRVFAIEKEFHEKILATESAEDRGRQYKELYSEVHRLQREGIQGESLEGSPANCARLVLTFRRELAGKSVLEVGCGEGLFLDRLAALLPHGELWGLDASEVTLPQGHAAIRFLRKDIVSFRLDRRFDVVYSHQVLEHIAPADIPSHLASVHASLEPAGKFIVILPNKFWGPQDITRIVDNTYSGRVKAQGSHLNESSYTELEPQLEASGFRNIRTILPFAHHVPILRDERVKPRMNRFFEAHAGARALANRFRRHGRPIFKNPIALIAEKPR